VARNTASDLNNLSAVRVRNQPDNRALNPSSPFRFQQTQTNFKSIEVRKTLGQGRLNKQFHQKVPTLKDDDIKELIEKYPPDDAVKENDDTAKKGSEGSDS